MTEGVYKYGYGGIAILAIVLLAMAMMTMTDNNTANSVDANSPSADTGHGSGPNSPAAAIETETPDAEEAVPTDDIKTIYISSNSDLGKMEPGILYITSTAEGDDPETHDGFIILEKDKLAGTVIPFYGTNVKIEMENGIYYDATGAIVTWGVIYRLPWADSTGRPIPERVKLIESRPCNKNLDGKYVMITIQN